MNLFRTLIFASFTASTLTACGADNDPTVGTGPDDAETETFRQALPAADDLEMAYAPDSTPTGMAGQHAVIAGLTARTVVGTNLFMIGHFAMMRAVAALPPTEAGLDYRVWEGEHDDLTLRVKVQARPAAEGVRYDYVVSGKVTATAGGLQPIIDGHVVRLDADQEPRDGFGLVRFHFDNLNDLQPERAIDGKVRVAFRKVNRAHQVHVRAIGVVTPQDPGFPPAAEYVYGVRPDTSGAIRWYSKSDVKQDSQPLENVAVHAAWRADKSGAGAAFVFGGSLEVDFWRLVECWGSNFVKGYDVLETPDARLESGELASCFATPESLEPPAFEETLADEDPAIPAPMPEENN